MLHRFARADHLDPRPLEGPGDLRPDDDDGAAPVGDDAAVEPMERIGDHGGAHDLLDGHHLAQEGVGIVLGMLRGGDLDPRELRARGSVLVHVAHGGHGVLVDHGGSEGKLERDVGRGPVVPRRGAGSHALGARAAGQGNQRDLALARGDGLGGVSHVNHVGRSPRLRGVDVPELESHVIRHGKPAQSRRVARAEVSVHVLPGEPGVDEGTLRRLRVELSE